MLNTAKRSRTTVEALETRGYTYAVNNPKVKKLRLSYLAMHRRDWLFVAFTVVYISLLFPLGAAFPNLLY